MNLRILAGLDLIYHGTRLVLIEFAAGVFVPLALGLLFVIRGRAAWQLPCGIYFFLLALNYLPLLFYSIHLCTSKDELSLLKQQVAQDPSIGAYYTARSFLLLLPLAGPGFWLIARLRKTS